MKRYEKCMKLIYSPCVALIGSLLIGSPQGLAQNAESSPSEPLRLTVAPHASSRIAMKTLPKATCALHPDGDSEPSHSFKLFSDDDGMIRFNVNPREESDEIAVFAVDCTSDNTSRTFGLELRSNSSPTSDMPAPTAEIRTTKPSDFIRPPLTKEDALQLSDDELTKRDYPMRPNPEATPAAFAGWLQVVTHPARRVDSRQVAYPELRAGSETSTNWSGFALENAPNEVPVSTYDAVQGSWFLPAVTAPGAEGPTYSVFWVGLDGDDNVCPKYCPLNSAGNHKTPDLWQAGTGQQTRPFLDYSLSTYFAWTELLPTQGIEVLPDLSVFPDDLIYVSVWVGNNQQQPASLSGAYGFAYVEDVTRGEYQYVKTPRGQVKILGYQAEWIMERPYENNALPALADYDYAYMSGASAMPINQGSISYDQPYNTQLFMYEDAYGTGDLLSAAFSYGPEQIYYVWYNSN